MGQKDTPINILSLNLAQLPFPIGISNRNKRAREFVNRLLNMENLPDVICLQELFTNSSRNIIKNGIEHIYPYNYIDYSCGKFLIGVNSGLAIFSKYPISSQILHTYKKYRGVENFAKKGVMGICIELENDKHCYVFTTHIQSGLGGSPKILDWLDKILNITDLGSDDLKLYQVASIINTINKLIVGKAPIFVAGDFNIEANTELYTEMLNILDSKKLYDNYDEENSENNSSVLDEDKIIDYIFSNMNGQYIILNTFGEKGIVTDHRAVNGIYKI
jgi:endonuclease/exonuclease/phosphatase family metal-dependent hydrolase